MRAMIARQLKGVPENVREQILSLVEKNPQFFETMAKDIQERVKKGEDKMMATQAVAMKHQKELMQMLMGMKK